MTGRGELARTVERLLGGVRAGSILASVDGRPLAALDSSDRTVTLQLEPLLEEGPRRRALLRESHLGVWEARGVPAALARAGWTLRIRDGPTELVRLGKDASALTGHVHVRLAALREVRRLL